MRRCAEITLENNYNYFEIQKIGAVKIYYKVAPEKEMYTYRVTIKLYKENKTGDLIDARSLPEGIIYKGIKVNMGE